MVSSYNFFKYIVLCELNYLSKLKVHSKCYIDHLVCTLPHGIYLSQQTLSFLFRTPYYITISVYPTETTKFPGSCVPSLPDTTTPFNLLEISLQS